MFYEQEKRYPHEHYQLKQFEKYVLEITENKIVDEKTRIKSMKLVDDIKKYISDIQGDISNENNNFYELRDIYTCINYDNYIKEENDKNTFFVDHLKELYFLIKKLEDHCTYGKIIIPDLNITIYFSDRFESQYFMGKLYGKIGIFIREESHLPIDDKLFDKKYTVEEIIYLYNSKNKMK